MQAHSESAIVILVGEYLAGLEARRCSPRTIQTYGEALRDFIAFLEGSGVRAAQEVTAVQIEAYRRHLRERDFSPAGEETYCRGIKRFFDAMEKTQRVFENPFAGMGALRRQPRRSVPVASEGEIAALLAVPDVSTPLGLRNRALLEVAYGTAARLDELTRMKLADLDLAHGTVRIMGKGEKERVVPLGRTAADWLGRYLREVRPRLARKETPHLWWGSNGSALGGQSIGNAVRACARKAGTATRITPHGLRRACVTHMLAAGAHPVQLQMLLGHASLAHLSAYLRVNFRELKLMHEGSRLGQ